MKIRLELTFEERIEDAAVLAHRFMEYAMMNVVFDFNGVECEVYLGEKAAQPCADRYKAYMLSHPEEFPR